MNIMYVGMPKCGSSWIFDNLKNHPEINCPNIQKEPHLYDMNCLPHIDKNPKLDFTTMNWAMNIETGAAIEHRFSHYIFMVRYPVHQLISWYNFTNDTKTLTESIEWSFINKMGCIGDIIERWYDTNDSTRFHIYLYEDFKKDNVLFYNKLLKDLNLSPQEVEYNITTNVTKYHTTDYTISQETFDKFLFQILKFEHTTGIVTEYIDLLQQEIV